ncbi:branched-chain amino acid ABC transporter permease [Halobacterium sp. KA-6]|jgi:branched-subunit amino acid ABC-type transport system permease component|uniref:branched-chain amino acid ABC transporter permease n=1 Tax=Halobacterium sp. KA-6 TaxID=2896368 RepID=UPI001E3DF139|nr:branched-chain amino acid ABC transporter permease [Halobacterium sp. KA-6]MCD2203383.1 branched-chain amino acid ABC transporter permease [Halobacterium sp. KA-6]
MVLIESLINGLIQGSIFAVFAASFTIIFGVMDIPNMGHAALFAGGAYAFYQLVNLTGLPWVVGLIGAVLIIALLGAAIEKAIISPLYDRKESEYVFGVILVTIGLSRILERGYAQIWGHSPKYIELGQLQEGSIQVVDTSVSHLELVVIAFAIANFVFLYWLINYTEIGLSLQAIVQDRELAIMRGINVNRVFLVAFTLGAAMISAAGILNAAMFTLEPTLGFSLLIKAFIIVILGGIGRVMGAMVAGYALGLYETFAVLYLSSYYIYASEFAVLIAFFLLKAIILNEGEESLITGLRKRAKSLRQGVIR